ncbi:putative required for the formation of a threonylcarbamoyl group on adenosine at position 37 (t(6)A37) in mitochondrial tRNAs that read codons beginning with adenine [Lyophyllum shimeji]|uniref:N(6)-L-threonylcarbamoyladenine synthase n=1 Tax=Lyophyllum shimeji TaxID=47721 RepID=A0A9P3PL07_LYOSH|nr:putative required for the formation of a threonylcarbamoyl group on adenosine at position 37 (t(6)A37) in mitochondrial tRNAs that read codons beginning with adenine [Lyophyllum shimeji]
MNASGPCPRCPAKQCGSDHAICAANATSTSLTPSQRSRTVGSPATVVNGDPALLARLLPSRPAARPPLFGRSLQSQHLPALRVPIPDTCSCAVESSADDTCAAVVTSSRQILSNVVIKQNDLHEGYGGIHPMVAIQAHQRNMPIAVKRALREANVDIRKDIDGIAFTRGPGIGGCLSVGSNAAKTLAASLDLPVVGVHHMQAHALTPLLTSWPNPPKFPFLTLLVSGGHTLLLLAKSLNSFRILATTPDESIGRSFDKVSRMLGLPWTARGPGAALEQFCAQPREGEVPELPPYPRPFKGQLAFSYSSLHSYVERYIDSKGGLENIDLPARLALARGFQTAAVAQLEEKVLLAFQWCSENNVQVGDVVVSGGVASNTYLRERLAACLTKLDISNPISLNFPPPALCTDNAVMIAWASMHRFLARDYDDYTIDLLAKWNIDTLSP